MKSKIESVKEFIKILKEKETTGMDTYTYAYIYKFEFKDLEDIINDYERIYTICKTGMQKRN